MNLDAIFWSWRWPNFGQRMSRPTLGLCARITKSDSWQFISSKTLCSISAQAKPTCISSWPLALTRRNSSLHSVASCNNPTGWRPVGATRATPIQISSKPMRWAKLFFDLKQIDLNSCPRALTLPAGHSQCNHNLASEERKWHDSPPPLSSTLQRARPREGSTRWAPR